MDMDTQQDEKQNLSKGGGAPCEPIVIHISCPTVSAAVLLQLGDFLLEGWWQDLNSSHWKTLHSTKPTNTTKTENPHHGSTSSAAAIHREAHRMRGLGQSLRDPHSLTIGGKARGKLPGSDYSSVCRGGAEG